MGLKTRSATGESPAAVRDGLVARIERLSALDAPAALLQKAVARLVPLGSPAKDALSGTWLGHPLHPPLTDVVVGSWTCAFLLDLLGGRRGRPGADALVGVGVLAAVPTAAAGLSDWGELRGGSRRVGAVHAVGNTTALALQAASWRARRQGRRMSGVGLSTLGMGVATLSAWLGGHLTFNRGVGVDQTVFEELPTDWTAVAGEERLEEDGPIRRATGGAGIMLVRHRGRVHALADRCSHRGCSLSEGTVADGAVTCPCHGTTFELAGGHVLRGPATAPQPVLETRIREGEVEVRRRSE